MHTEAKAYLTEVFAGTRNISSAWRNWSLSVTSRTTQTGTLTEAFQTLIKER